MKSIRYSIFKKKPHNLDDCLDYSTKNKPSKVSLEVTFDEYISVEYILKHLIGVYVWEFPDKTIKVDKIYDALLYTDSEKKQMQRVDIANKSLGKDISRIKTLGIELKDEHKRFDYSIIYTQKGDE